MVLRELAADPKAAFTPTATLFQTFLMQCRQYQVPSAGIDMAGFRRRFALALAGMDRVEPDTRSAILQLAAPLEDDLLAPFLLIARSAAQGHGTPDEDQLARVYGTSSPSRIRRLLDHLEKRGLIVVREDYGGERSVSVPGLAALAA
jgi:uncharacterized protein